MTPFYRPDIMSIPECQPVSTQVRPRSIASRLRKGEVLLWTGSASRAREICHSVRAQDNRTSPEQGHAERRQREAATVAATKRLMVPVTRGKAQLEGADPCGFLPMLYGEEESFAISFPDLLDLTEAWVRFEAGVPVPTLGYRLHPFYGAYMPTRMTHLELFATWLSGYEGPKRAAVDVGTGSGVLSYLVARAGFEDILCTDVNPNALESVRRELQRRSHPGRFRLHHGDLLPEGTEAKDLIVFNPPWTLRQTQSLLDKALYFEEGLFERFFSTAHRALNEKGRVVIVFSNVIELVQPEVQHPVKRELESGRFTLVKKLQRKVGAKGRQGRRTREKVELWELGLR